MPTSAESLAGYGTATVHEALGRRGLMGGIKLLVGPAFAGPALTVELPAGDNLGLHALLEHAPAGAVLCVASGGRGVFGVLGDLLQEAARARGVAALVIEDGIRDIAALDPPPSIAACGISARGTIKQRLRHLGEPVAIGGVLVKPGDWIVGDGDGVCVVPAAKLEVLLEAAEARVNKEAGIRAKLKAGETSVDVLGLGGQLRGNAS